MLYLNLEVESPGVVAEFPGEGSSSEFPSIYKCASSLNIYSMENTVSSQIIAINKRVPLLHVEVFFRSLPKNTKWTSHLKYK